MLFELLGRNLRSGVAIVVLAQLASCGGGSNNAPSVPAPPPTPPADTTSGLTNRPNNATCLAPERPSSAVSLSLARVFPALTFSTPVGMFQAPQDTTRWYVIEQGGRVRVFPNTDNPTAATSFIDLTSATQSGGEMGLLGMAFHPAYPTDTRVYISYTPKGTPRVSRISEFRTSDGGATLNASTERVLLTVNQPEENHKGGNIAFGPDGFLYIGLGDGGGGGDGHGAIGNGQNLQTLLGKMLRIDVNTATSGFNYSIPNDNPFAGNPLCGANGTSAQSCPEIFAYGFRNPWRWSFDRDSGQLWVGDVGQGAWEEVDLVVRGANYGWRCREGAHPFNAACGTAPQSPTDPVAEYGRTAGASITGGFVYRGSAIPSLRGRYVFADFVSGRLWHIARETPPTLEVTAAQALDSGLSISSFAQGADGELYVLHYSGTVHRLQASSGAVVDTIPAQLSATGCVNTADAKQPAGGLVPYVPNAPFWSDGAEKDRWLAIPDGQRMTVGTDNDWEMPNGSVLVKNFRRGTRLIETRLFMRHPDGVWAGYSYEWNTAQTDATRVVGGKTVTVEGQPWIFPSEAQCLSCHTEAAGRSLGLETAQLNADFLYTATNRTANQVHTLNSVGMLTPTMTGTPATWPVLASPASTATLNDRARAYLHTNCAQCHRPGGGTPVEIDLRYTTALNATEMCNVAPASGDVGIAGALIVAPGDASKSVLVARMNRRDTNAMPPLASALVDTAGVDLISAWINGLANCN